MCPYSGCQRSGGAPSRLAEGAQGCWALMEGAALERIPDPAAGNVGDENDRMPDLEQTVTRALAGTGTRLAHSRRVAAQVGEAIGVV